VGIDPFKTRQNAVVHSVVVTPHDRVQANISGKSVLAFDEAEVSLLTFTDDEPIASSSYPLAVPNAVTIADLEGELEGDCLAQVSPRAIPHAWIAVAEPNAEPCCEETALLGTGSHHPSALDAGRAVEAASEFERGFGSSTRRLSGRRRGRGTRGRRQQRSLGGWLPRTASQVEGPSQVQLESLLELRHDDGCGEQCRKQFSGVLFGNGAGLGQVHERAPGVSQLRDHGEVAADRRLGGRRCVDTLPQLFIHDGVAVPSSREDLGFVHVYVSRLLTEWHSENAANLEKLEGLEEARSRSVPRAGALEPLVCLRLPAQPAWLCRDGSRVAHDGCCLSSSLRADEPACGGPSGTSHLDQSFLDSTYLSKHEDIKDKGGRERRLDTPGCEASIVDRSCLTDSQASPTRTPLVLRLCSILFDDETRQCLDGSQSCAISGSPFGAEHRSRRECADSGGSTKTRTLEIASLVDPLREARPLAVVLQPEDTQHARLPRLVRNTRRGRCPRQRDGSARLVSVIGGQQYVADLFSGIGGVARHCRRLGAVCREFDIVHGSHGDLLNPLVLKRLKYDIRHSICVGVMLAPPCTSFSVAQDRTLQVRNEIYPWGFRTLPPTELEKVFQANRLAVVVIKILTLCQQFSIPWILENPSTSRFWYLPQIARFLDSSTVHSRVCDYCQYGAPWRKRTRFAFGNLDEFDSLRLDKRCRGTFCSRTGKPHITLSGCDANNIAWTHRAQPHPNTLSRHIAFCLVSSLRAAYLHQV
jgi:hypothetical protein